MPPNHPADCFFLPPATPRRHSGSAWCGDLGGPERHSAAFGGDKPTAGERQHGPTPACKPQEAPAGAIPCGTPRYAGDASTGRVSASRGLRACAGHARAHHTGFRSAARRGTVVGGRHQIRTYGGLAPHVFLGGGADFLYILCGLVIMHGRFLGRHAHTRQRVNSVFIYSSRPRRVGIVADCG